MNLEIHEGIGMIQLFIFPFAGGNKTSFNKLIERLNEEIEAITIEYSGRGERLQEGYITDYRRFVSDVVNQINKHRKQNMPYAFLGYSMGSALVYEIAANDYIDPELVHIFYSARACVRDEKLKELSDKEFIEHATQLGGFNEEVLKNKRLFRLFIHPLQDDYHIAIQYQYSPGMKEITCDSTVFYSEADTPFDSVEGWKNLTKGNTGFYEIGENHFFLYEHYKEMAEIINQKLKTNVRTGY